MVGQFIYVRCKNAQGNGGSWIAAISEGAAGKEVVQGDINPKCTLEESFAQRNMQRRSTNSVLRIYHPEGRTVVSRTYWAHDEMVDGRMAAFCHGYILTDKDSIAFQKNYQGAFDEACFDKYADVVARVRANNGTFTLNSDINILQHGNVSLDGAKVLASCGIDQQKFIELMSTLYRVIREGKQLAVILPRQIREAWAENGDNTAELLALLLYSLVPSFVREKFGLVSHWGCNLEDRNEKNGIHLFFVHPASVEDYAELKKAACPVLDLEGDHSTGIEEADNRYFSFVWDHVDRREELLDFWNYAKKNYLELLKARQVDASLMEAVYLLRKASEGGFAAEEDNRIAFQKAGLEIPEAGGVIPVFDETVLRLLTALEVGETELTKEEQRILASYLKGNRNAPFAEKIYEILLSTCRDGTLEPACQDIMCDELKKRGSFSDVMLTNFFRAQFEQIENGSIKQTVYVLACKLLVRLVRWGVFGKRAFTLEGILREFLIKWSEKAALERNSQELSFLTDTLGFYLKSEQREDADLAACGYRVLNAGLLEADEDLSNRCENALMEEEKGIYRGTRKLSTVEKCYQLFQKAVVSSLNDVERIWSQKEEKVAARAFRQVFFGGKKYLGQFPEVYRDLLSRDKDNLFAAEEKTLAEMGKAPAIWSKEKVGEVLPVLEKINGEVLEYYAPKAKRFEAIISWYDKATPDLADLILRYLKGLNSSLCEDYLSVLENRGLLQGLLPWLFLEGEDLAVFRQAAVIAKADRRQILAGVMVAASGPEGEKYCTNEALLSRFDKWYREELQAELEAAGASESGEQSVSDINGTAAKQLAFLLEERESLRLIPNHSVAFGRKAADILEERISYISAVFRPADFGTFPMEMVRRFTQSSSSGSRGSLSGNVLFQIVAKADEALQEGDFRSLDEVVTGRASGQEKEALRYRLKYYSEKLPRTSREQRVLCDILSGVCFKGSTEPLATSRTYQTQKEEEKVSLLLKLMQAFLDMPATKKSGITVCMKELSRLSREDPKLFRSEEQRNLYRQLKYDEAVYYCSTHGLSNEFDKGKKRGRGIAFSPLNIGICAAASFLAQAAAFVILEILF